MPEKATAKKSKVAVKEQGKAFEVLCALRYIKKGIEGLEETYEGTAKDEVMDKFVAEGLEKHDRPANYRGKSGKGEASCQLQLRGSKSPLTADQVESITKLGLEVHEEEVSPEQFIFNSSVLSSPELRAKISAALSKIDCGLDDEGNPSQRNVLIEDGILKGYIQDSLNARLMGVAPTGNGRRESYAHIPMPRMTNTYMLGGDKDPQEIIASIKKGLYASNFGGGQVDITSGKFVFSASEAYWVEDGKIQYPVKGATIVGSGPESLKKVTMIGNDMRLDSGVGTCGKEGQSVPVGVGQPTLRVDGGLTVGGVLG
jgi:broad specificity phosphatase PhoE